MPFNPNIKDGRGTRRACRSPKSNWANTIEEPPFEAYAVTCGITFTFGGLKIDTSARVIDTDGAPIPGLYAAGELVGGIFYFNYPGGTGPHERRRVRPHRRRLRRAPGRAAATPDRLARFRLQLSLAPATVVAG